MLLRFVVISFVVLPICGAIAVALAWWIASQRALADVRNRDRNIEDAQKTRDGRGHNAIRTEGTVRSAGINRVMGFQHRAEAEGFLTELRARLAEYGLELHAGKTRLVEFGRFAASNRAARGEGKPETFEFLGFTHICARRRSDGGFTMLRKTIGRRLGAKAKEVRKALKRRRHRPVPEQGRWLRSVVQGFFTYHGVPGNRRALDSFRRDVQPSATLLLCLLPRAAEASLDRKASASVWRSKCCWARRNSGVCAARRPLRHATPSCLCSSSW